MGVTSGLSQPCTCSTHLPLSGLFGSVSTPQVSSCPVGCAKSQQECLPPFWEGEVSVWVDVEALTRRRSMLPALSMSAYTPLPRQLDLMVGGNDGENLGSTRGVDPKESERNESRASDSPTSYGSLNLLVGFAGWWKVVWICVLITLHFTGIRYLTLKRKYCKK